MRDTMGPRAIPDVTNHEQQDGKLRHRILWHAAAVRLEQIQTVHVVCSKNTTPLLPMAQMCPGTGEARQVLCK